MTLDEVRKRFLDEINLRSYDDKFIDRKEEREILQVAVQHDVGVEVARAALLGVCEQRQCVVESRVRQRMKDQMDMAASRTGRLDESAFRDILQQGRLGSQNKIDEAGLKKMFLELVDGHGYSVDQGWLLTWFDDLRRETAS